MISSPSLSDFGTHDESRYPELWDGCLYASAFCLGVSGGRLFDHARLKNNGTATAGMVLNERLILSQGQYCFEPLTSQAFTHEFIPNLTGDCTWSAWFRYTTTGSDQCLFTTRNILTGASRNGIALFFRDGNTNSVTAEFAISGTRYSARSPTFTFQDGKWRCMVGRRINGFCYIDVNDVAQGVSSSSSTATITHEVGLRIGAWADYTTGAFVFQCDDFRIYDRALSTAEVLLLQSQRGVAYQRRRRRSYFATEITPAFKASWIKKPSQLIGGGTY